MDCSCIFLANGVSDVLGFNHPRRNCYVIVNHGQNPIDLCEGGHRCAPGASWLISKSDFEDRNLGSTSNAKIVAKFGAKEQLLKS
jgi:hypothetical protein